MTTSLPQIVAQLDAVLERDASAVVVAIRSVTRQSWPEALSQRGRSFELRWCESTLAVRESLANVEHIDSTKAGLVILTPLGTNELAADIIARLTRGQIFEPEGWEIVRQLFAAKEIDARLRPFPWMPQTLIDGAAQGKYQPVANGFLDLESAWKEVLFRFLQIEIARPDAAALLAWTMQPSADTSLNLLSPVARRDALRWLEESAGVTGGMVQACVNAGRTGDAMALGLVCGVLFSVDGEGQTSLGHASIRLERFVNDTHVGILEGRAWAKDARQLLMHEDGPDLYRAALDRADTLLNELRVAEFAHLSDVLPMGFEQRMRAFAAALSAHVLTPTDAHLSAVEQTANCALAHVLATTQAQRSDRIEMARRIARWLMRSPVPAVTVSDIVCWQAEEGAFVDWARFRLLGGDELVEVSHAYEAVRSAVINRRNGLGRQFALALQKWNVQAPVLENRIVPLESVLERVVAPLSLRQPVLLLVVDGLSASIFRELFARIERFGWTEMVPVATAMPLVGVAVLPTITEVSRASLLCGKLTTGVSSSEKTHFSAHPALQSRTTADLKPTLFHKGDLSDASNLASEVRATIANPKQRVVGLVYNAVDDHLSGPDQLHQRWNLEDLRLFPPILREAREARRILIVTSDHGHLLEDGTHLVAGGNSDRWHACEVASNDDELVFSGGRVRTASGAKSVACLWSESARYAGRKNGYHGGVSPQEVAVPLSVFVPSGMALPDWQAALPVQPEWWDLPMLPPAISSTVRHSATPNATPRRNSTPSSGQVPLFDVDTAPVPPPVEEPDWIALLLTSQVYVSQRALAARVAPPDEQVHKLLTALAERGGKLSRAALAQRLGVPELRLNGLLSAMRRVLNVDQATALLVDESAGTIELNRVLLLQQFGISIHGSSR